MKPISIFTSDHVQIAAHLFEPSVSNHKLIVINSATGVKQQVYFSFAKFLAENGFTVITYDYRGIGLSKPQKLKGFKASMRIWGTSDFRAVTDFVKNNYPKYEKFCLGHSVGALILGMNKDASLFKKFIFVATQDAFAGHLPKKIALSAYLGFGVVVPIISQIMGYFPAHWFRLGETLPKGSALDWRTLILHKKSTSRLFEKIENDYSKNLNQETLVIYAEDDPWVKMKGMESLMNTGYPNLRKKYRKIVTTESPQKKIGHINFFRSYNKNLWNIVLEEIL